MRHIDSTVTPGLPRRLACMCYEAILLLAVALIGLVLPYAILGAFALRAASSTVLWLHLFLLFAVYFVGFWTHGGQTLPMKTWRIRLVPVRGSTIPRAQALLRYALSWPSLLFFGAGIVWALFDRDRQFLHDRLAGTRVIISR